MYSRILEARQGGAVVLDLYGYESNIEIVEDPTCSSATISAWTEASSGPTVEVIDKLRLRESGRTVELRLPDSGGVIVSTGGSVQIGRNNGVVIGNGGFMSTSFGGGGGTDVTVNGQRIQVRDGKTWVNGVEVGGSGEPAGEPPMPIHLRAVVPVGSIAHAETYNGNIKTDGVVGVRLKSYNGNLSARGLAQESRLKTYNGAIKVGAVDGTRPAVEAETYNGNITALDDNVRLRPKTYNGRVKYPN